MDEVNRLIREGKTIGEIRGHLAALGTPVSHGATGRYVKSAREAMAESREASQVASQWVQQLGENPSGDVGTLLNEMLKTIAYQTLGSIKDQIAQDKMPKPGDIMFLAKAFKDLEAASKGALQRREVIEKMALERQAKAAESVARENGLSDDQWAAIRAKFLGIQDEAAP